MKKFIKVVVNASLVIIFAPFVILAGLLVGFVEGVAGSIRRKLNHSL